ncbi:DNA-binding protein [Ramlibacter sp. AN1015]|uniref:DNA-binding protein n=1 Tax=Ramlibacter sp. AN1015 TaxID=3133428 RepID=UPI0030C2AE17
MTKEVVDTNPERVPTERFAARNHVKPGTVLKQLCKTGGYHGVVPVKLANNRWDWPNVVVVKR